MWQDERIGAGNTNETLTAETGTGFFTVKGDATLTSGAVITPVCNTTHGGGIVFRFKNLDVYAEVSWSPGRKVVPYTAEQIAAAFPGATFSVAGGSNTSYRAQDGTVCVYEGPSQHRLMFFVR